MSRDRHRYESPVGEKRPFDAPEVYGGRAIANIVRALPPLERAYSLVRFSILRPKLLSVMDLLLTDEDGAFLTWAAARPLCSVLRTDPPPATRSSVIDPNARRIELARRVAGRLGMHQHSNSSLATSATRHSMGPFDAAYVLDVMHHLPPDDQRRRARTTALAARRQGEQQS